MREETVFREISVFSMTVHSTIPYEEYGPKELVKIFGTTVRFHFKKPHLPSRKINKFGAATVPIPTTTACRIRLDAPYDPIIGRR